jgi:5-methyltetrahydropteroyltriglutamate--homocysteine methyltransferase
VVAATRGLDRGRTDKTDVEAAYGKDLARWIEIQRQAGLDFYSDGLLRWQDIFRPLSDTLEVKPHTLVRWFDTNTFFREPELERSIPLAASPDGAVAHATVPTPRVATLPSPYMFSRAGRTGRDRNELMLDLATNLLRPAVEAAARHGAGLIHLEEPWLGYYGIEPGDWDSMAAALDVLHRNAGAKLALHVYFGDAASYMDRLLRLPVDVIGIDLVETDVGALGSNWDKGLIAGVINGRSSIVESLDNTVQVVRHLAETVAPHDLYISSNCELSYLPTAAAERKVQRLGEAARKLKQLVSV